MKFIKNAAARCPERGQYLGGGAVLQKDKFMRIWSCAVALSLGLAGLAGQSQASSTLYLTGVSPTANMNITFPGPDTYTNTPYVGMINWSFNPATNSSLAALLPPGATTLSTFCIEGTQNVYINQNSTFSVLTSDIASRPQDNAGSHFEMGSTAAALLQKFWDVHYGDIGSSSVNAAAFQLGVWEIVYDGSGDGGVYNFGAGNFKASSVVGNTTSANALSTAQGWLNGLASASDTTHYNLYVLGDNGLQDQIFGVAAPTTNIIPPVPLPSALPAGVTLLSGLAAAHKLRRRKTS
jgi:hypothetical protein